MCAEYSIKIIDSADRLDWHFVVPVHGSPYRIYRQSVIKGDQRRADRAMLIITVLMNWDIDGELRNKGIPGMQWSELIDRVVPLGFNHRTSADRVIQDLVKFGVIKRVEKNVTRNQKRTYYSIDDVAAFSSQVNPAFIEKMPHRLNEKEVCDLADNHRLFIQAEAGRRVLERNKLTAEWVAECKKLALEPVVTENRWPVVMDCDDEEDD